MCSEALHADELQKCSLEKCVEETKKRCPFRDLTRARANNFIKAIAVPGNIWDESDADHFCKTWYGDEISNVTRMGAVWDALYMLPCPNTESAIRRMKTCYTIETSNVAALHPMAQFCYSSYPIDLGIGQSVSTQCCYGSDLKLLVLGQKGAGAVDFASKLANHEMSESDHFENDLFPNMACCQLSDNCVKFSAMRPPSVRPETDEEAQASCGAMNSKYSWKPYGKYQPPYARSSEIMTWKEMQLTSESLVPTKKLSELLVASQKVRDAVEKGNNPYESEQAPSAKPLQKPDGKPDEPEQHEEKPTAKPTEKPLVPPEKPTHHDEETPQEKPQHHEEQSQHEEKPMHHDEESQHHGEQKPQLHEETPSHHEEEKPQLHEEKPTHHEEQMPQNHEEEKPSHHEETPSHLEEEKPQHHEEKPQHDDEHHEAQPQHHEEEPQHHEEPSHLKRSSEKVNKKAASKEKGFAKDFGTKKTDRDLDAAIEAVLKGQTKKASKSTGKSKAKHVEASKESNSQHVEKHSDENQDSHERNAERRRRRRHQGSN